MPSAADAKAQMEWMISKGRGNEKVHVVLVEEIQKKRIKNDGPKPQTRFVLETDSPEAYSEMHLERDRIIRKCGNKSVAISLLIRAWRDALCDQVLDQILAQMEDL